MVAVTAKVTALVSRPTHECASVVVRRRETFAASKSFDAAFDLGRQEVDDAQLIGPARAPPTCWIAWDGVSLSGREFDSLRAAASALLRPFMLRRIKADVEKGLPKKLETLIACPLSAMQVFWYKRLLLRESSLLAHLESEHADAAASSGTDWRKLSSLLMQVPPHSRGAIPSCRRVPVLA
jgi:hypothetical protein